MLIGEAFTRKLLDTSAAANAVAGSGSRSRAKKAAAKSGDISKLAALAKKAMKAGESFCKAERWSNAAGAYQEALSYPKEALDAKSRFTSMVNLTACFCQLRRGKEAVENARRLCDENPGNPAALYGVANAMHNPCQGRLSEEAIDEIVAITENVEQLLLENPVGGPLWYVGYSREELLHMAKRIRNYVIGQRGPQSPAVAAAQTAIDEFNSFGSIVKAARAVDEALKPENNHPNPHTIRSLRGNIYYQWGTELIDSISKGEDRSVPESERIYVEGEGSRLEQAVQKFETALSQFVSCAGEAAGNEWPEHLPVWNEALALIVLGKFDEGCSRCVDSLRLRLEDEMSNVTDDGVQELSSAGTNVTGNHDFVLHVDKAFEISRSITAQKALAGMYGDSFEGVSCDQSSDLQNILDRALEMKLLDFASAKEVTNKISSNELDSDKVYFVWAHAVLVEESGKAAYADLRAKAAAALVEFTLSLKQNMSAASSRVIGTILKEALEWDPDASIPEELSKAESLVAEPKRCGSCGAADPPHSCPCGNAHYCGRKCQKRGWREHKKNCTLKSKG